MKTRLISIPFLTIGLLMFIGGLMQPAKPKPRRHAVTPPAVPSAAEDQRVAKEVIKILEDTLSKDTGGNPRQQSIRIGLGFDTAHIRDTPQVGTAMKTVLDRFLYHYLVRGDTVSIFGYQDQLDPSNHMWNVSFEGNVRRNIEQIWQGFQPIPVVATSHTAAIKPALDEMKFGENPNTVIMLVSSTVTNQARLGSQGQDRTPLDIPGLNAKGWYIQQPDPILIMPPETPGGQAVTLSIRIVYSNNFASGPKLTDDRVTLFRNSEAVEPAGGGGSVKTSGGGGSDDAPIGQPNSGMAVAGGGLMLVGLVLLLLKRTEPEEIGFRIRLNQGPESITSVSGPFDLNTTICRFIGPGVAKKGESEVVIGEPNNVPPVVIAEIIRKPNGKFRFISIYSTSGTNGILTSSGAGITPGKKEIFEIRGSKPIQLGEAPVTFNVKLEVDLK